jgi:hypothetical protein
MVSKVMMIHILLYILSLLERFWIYLTKHASIEKSGTEVHFVILGDETCLLKTHLMKPFARKDLSSEEHAINSRLSRARGYVVCAFGTLRAKLRLLNKAVERNGNKAERIVRWFCSLHIVIIALEGKTRDPSVLEETSQIHGTCQTKTNVSGRSFNLT